MFTPSHSSVRGLKQKEFRNKQANRQSLTGYKSLDYLNSISTKYQSVIGSEEQSTAQQPEQPLSHQQQILSNIVKPRQSLRH